MKHLSPRLSRAPLPSLADVRAELRRRGLPSRAAGSRFPTFRAYVEHVRPSYRWFKHVDVLGGVLERVLAGEITRLMIFEPPRHGKSEQTSRLFSGYFLLRYPERWVALTSYSAELAGRLAGAAKENYLAAGGPLRGARGRYHWETGEGGGMWAAGVGGSATGKGWHLGIIDDPIKNSSQAASAVIRSGLKEWHQSTFSTREEPEGGALIVIQTRWHEDDLAGWLLQEERSDDEPERWHIVHLPAIRPDVDQEFPASCTVEPDWRAVGEPLCPERYDLKKLQKREKRIGAYYWAALYQGEPKPRDGDFFKLAWLSDVVERAPEEAERVRYWDKAATSGGGDYSAGVLVAYHRGILYVEDVVRGQWSSGERDRIIRSTAASDNARYRGRVHTIGEMEPGSSGKDVAAALIQDVLRGFWASAESVTGDKETRARPFASQAESGNVKVVAGAWNKEWRDELTGFPRGTFDDQVDATGGAANRLMLGGTMEQDAEGHSSFWGDDR